MEDSFLEWLIQGFNTEDISLKEGEVSFDVMVTCNLSNKLYIEVEGQKGTDYLEYPLTNRATYYLGRLISRQKMIEFQHSDYQNLRKSYLSGLF